ncbi:hypothetical protein L218DRAFT_296421 [Marasmius fiardii PR-910]|nr:hypothetical protein L218DRAFT_296421 [Marasmius fiardii PR-910]
MITSTTSSASTPTSSQSASRQSHYHRPSSEKLPLTASPTSTISWLLGATPQPNINSALSIQTRASHNMTLSMRSRLNTLEGPSRGIPVKDQAEPFSVSRIAPAPHICQGPISSSSRQVGSSSPPLMQMLCAAATTLRHHGMNVSHVSSPYSIPPAPSLPSKQAGNDAVLDPLTQALPGNCHSSPVPQAVENSNGDEALLAKRLQTHVKKLKSKPDFQRGFSSLKRKQVADE